MKNENKNINIFKTQSGRTARTVSGWRKLPQDRTTITGTSMTVPNMSYEIKDLLTNYSRGIDLIGQQPEGVYDDSPSHDNLDASAISRMDIYDQSEVITQTITQSKKLQEQLKSMQQQQQEQEKARREALSKNPPPANPPKTSEDKT